MNAYTAAGFTATATVTTTVAAARAGVRRGGSNPWD